jgi:Fe2+ transport system protein FeoA
MDLRMSVAIREKPLLCVDSIPLQRLNSGRIGKVASIRGTNHEIARLAEMGLRSGEIVSVTRGGITSIVQLVSGSRLCVRTSNKLEILVTPL